MFIVRQFGEVVKQQSLEASGFGVYSKKTRKEIFLEEIGGQDGHPGRGCWSLPAPPDRANPALSDRSRILPGVRWPFGGAGRGVAGVYATGVRGLPEMRPSRTWVGLCGCAASPVTPSTW